MKIQKGIVKYKDRNDIVCTYGITDDGKQYYFLDENDEKKFSNGNRIASTALVEAIDPMFKASHIGVIDENGNVVIPFENKAIKPINDDIILVERSVPQTQSVIEANSLKSDPLAATKLVSTPALIKDKLNSRTGSDARYIFNDQFSEASVFDINGNNLINNEYYSFIVNSNGKLYFSKNTADSPISEYSILPKEVQSDITPNNDSQTIDVSQANVDVNTIENALNGSQFNNEQVASSDNSFANDITAQSMEQSIPTVEEEVVNNSDNNVVENTSSESGANTTDPMDSIYETYNDSNNEISEEVNNLEENKDVLETTSDDLVNDVVTNTEESNSFEDNINNQDIHEDTLVDTYTTEESSPIENQSEEINNDEVSTSYVEDSQSSEVEDADNNSNESQEVNSEEVENNSIESQDSEDKFDEVEDNTTNQNSEKEEEFNFDNDDDLDLKLDLDDKEEDIKTDEVSETDTNSLDDLSYDYGDNTTVFDNMVDEVNKHELSSVHDDTDVFKDSLIHPDKMDINDSYMDSYYDHDLNITSDGDTIMSDVAKSMTNLIKQNKEQRSIIDEYQTNIEKLNASRRNIIEKAKAQEQKIEILSDKVKNYEFIVNKVDSKNQLLEKKVHDQERLIINQRHELDVLRSQLQGKEDLVKLLADAKTLLDDDSYYKYDNEESFSNSKAA
jgi:hypothetical protein